MSEKISLFIKMIRFLLVPMFAFCFVQTASAQVNYLPSDKNLPDYHLDIWNSDRGMPFNSTLQIMQTSDGYILISSFEGLLRFDGVKFDLISRNKIAFLQTSTFTAVAEDKNGDILAAAYGSGILRAKNWQFELIPELSHIKAAVNSIKKLPDGKVYFLTRGEGLWEYDGKKAVKIPLQGLVNNNILSICKTENTLWIGTEGEGLWAYKNQNLQKISFPNSPNPNNVSDIKRAKNGRIWLATDIGTAYIEHDSLLYVKEIGKQICTSILLDEEDNAYFGTMAGLFRFRNKSNSYDKLTSQEGLHCDDLRGMFFDKEGGLWVSTYKAGIFRLKNAKFSNISYKNALPDKPVNAVIELGKGEILTGNDLGQLFLYRNREVLPFFLTKISNDKIKSLLKDSKGNIWVGTYSGLKKAYNEEKLMVYDKNSGLTDNQVRVIFEDSQGNIWAGTRSGGLNVFKNDGTLTHFTVENGLHSNFIMDIKEDKNGNMLIATNTSGLDIIQKDGKIAHFDTQNGLPTNLIFRVCVDEENIIWLATNAGLVRIKNQKAEQIGFKQGLYTESVYDVRLDPDKNFWLPTVKGVMKISKKICNDVLDGKRNLISALTYNKTDGMLTEECNGTGQNMIDSEGNLWVTTFRGLSYTSVLPQNKLFLPPKTIIEQTDADGKITEFPVTNAKIIEISPDCQRLVFRFTALHFDAPTQLNFACRLEGFDKDVILANKEREISYTNLPPGEYVFSVNAGTKEGFWGKEVKIKLKKLPFFYQTAWFWLVVFCSFVLIFYLFYLQRLKAVQRQKEKLANLVELRTAEINLQKEELLAQRDRIEDQKTQLEKSYNKLNTVSEIGQKVTSVLDFSDLIDLIYKEVNKLLRAEGFGIGLYNPTFKRLDFRGFIENGEKLPFSFDDIKDKDKLSVHCFLSGETILINDVDAYYRNKKILDTTEHGGSTQSLIYLPLRIENDILGVITVQSFSRDAYRDYHLTTFQALAAYIAVALANAKAYEIINEKNRNITDSIRYAMTIQQSILPRREEMLQSLKDVFILSLPKDIVSGDFYWSRSVGAHTHFAVVDCTGHGVPGAFMSLIGNMLLNEIVNVLMIYQPEKILQQLDAELRKALNQNADSNSDGMDVCLCFIEPQDELITKIYFSGAKRPLYHLKNALLTEHKGTKKSIGGHIGSAESDFFSTEIIAQRGDILYLTTDGYADQANENRQKFSTQKLKSLLAEVGHLPLHEQELMLKNSLLLHQGTAAQRDDITIAGILIA